MRQRDLNPWAQRLLGLSLMGTALIETFKIMHWTAIDANRENARAAASAKPSAAAPLERETTGPLTLF
jgi:hypothetical protein